jgi:hypothetical protein
MLYFLKWFVVGVFVSTLTFVLVFVVETIRGQRTSPEIGAVSFTLQWALTWICVGALVIALIATGVRVFGR